MASCYKIWTIVEGSSGCLPHGWTWSAMVLVYFRFTFWTTAQPCRDVFAFFGDLGQWKSVSMAREVRTDIQQLERRTESIFQFLINAFWVWKHIYCCICAKCYTCTYLQINLLFLSPEYSMPLSSCIILSLTILFQYLLYFPYYLENASLQGLWFTHFRNFEQVFAQFSIFFRSQFLKIFYP